MHKMLTVVTWISCVQSLISLFIGQTQQAGSILSDKWQRATAELCCLLMHLFVDNFDWFVPW